MLDRTPVQPKESLSIAYEFFAYTSIPAKNYKLVIAVFYADSKYDYSNVVYNGHVTVIESDQTVGVTGLFSMILTGAIVFLLVFVAYVKIGDRFGGNQEGRRKKQGGILGTLRELISS